MNARLRPLEGKYYGTIVEVELPYGEWIDLATIWVRPTFKPSDRQLENDGVTREQYDAAQSDKDKRMDLWERLGYGDGHYEAEGDYLIAQAIVAALKDLDIVFGVEG